MTEIESKKSFKRGETIMRQGEPGQSAYIIEKGRVEILITTPMGKEQLVGTRGAGTMIGEMALIDAAPRTATIKALEDCRLLEITKADFARRLENADPVLRMTSQVILTRYRDTLARMEITGENRNWPPAEAIELNYAQQGDAVGNIKLANELHAAIDAQDIELHYQPIINLQTGKVVGFEALMRWEHAEKGFISPAVFIPVAEDSGLILKASRWALREACRALNRIEHAAGYPDHSLFMAVNFSSTDFAADDFVDSVYTTISETDLHADQIHLEITERLLMKQPENARDTLDMCRKAGMSIAIDDFGTGYSSLSYLHYFPIDTLKIDQSFVRDMHGNEQSMELVKSIISLGKNLKMKIIAEGVEKQEEGKALKDLGCDMAQGYYFSKPIPEQDLIDLITNWKTPEY